uniref:Integrase catalytic domain-containing protein n=1 Tax=Fagus sylvatica TaxID=28930 RepID=A0A2N9IWV9_FAGSY
MSGVPLSSRRPRSVVQRESKSSTQKISSKMSYKPSRRTKTSYKSSWHIEASYKLSDEATVGGASVVASSQHTDPNDKSFGRTDRWATSKELGSHNSDRGNARGSLKYSSTASQAEDSERIISKLRREIRDLKQETRGRSPAKERPRNRSESRSLTPQPVPTQPLEYGKHSRSRPPLHIGKGPQTKEQTSRKTARLGRQHAVWKALDLVSSSPFSRQIERAELLERYTAPCFEIYNGRTDPVAHIGRYQQSMALSRYNDPLMCRLFPSSLGEVALRWEMDALLTMKLEDNETIKEYSTRFWETWNDITMILGVTKRLRKMVVEPHRPQTVAQPKVITPKPSTRSNNAAKSLSTPSNFVAPTFRAFETVFKKPIYKLLEKIKREPFFVWPPKLLGNPALRDGKLYYTYHKDTGHMTENCHMLKVHLERLVSAGHLNQYVDTNLTNKKEPSQTARQPHSSGMASTGVIHVIHNPLCSTISSGSYRSKIQKAAHLRKSFSIIDFVHPAPMCSVSKGVVEQIISFLDKGTHRPGELCRDDVSRSIHEARLGRSRPDQFYIPHIRLLWPERVFFDLSNPELFFLIGSKLSTMDRGQLLQLLMSNRDVFAWSVYDAPGVSPDLACHVLNIFPEHKLVPQKRQKLALERAAIVLEEVERLLESGAIREVQYPVWLSNTVVVKKKHGKWRVCIDFTDLNKACPKDPFPLPQIDQLVDLASRHARLSFLDAFQGDQGVPINSPMPIDSQSGGTIVLVFGGVRSCSECRPGSGIGTRTKAGLLRQQNDGRNGVDYDPSNPSNPSLVLPNATQLSLITGRWELFVDGASNSKGSRAGIVLVSPEGSVLEQVVRLKFFALNNEAEYEALMIGLRTARKLGANHLQADTLKYVRECDKYQRFAPMIHQPAKELNPLSNPWPFAQWGLDIVGPLPQAPGNKRTLMLKNSSGKNVITRFGTPWAAISDNGTQFESRLFKRLCSELGIKNFFSPPGYPQSNGQAEAFNKIILSGIKKKLEEAKGKWVEELPSVLWTHRTTVRKSTGETPFALAYGVEAVILLKVGIPTTRTTDFNVETNEDNLRKDLDLLEERRDLAMVQLASY